jgi:signal transduction histidine kinase
MANLANEAADHRVSLDLSNQAGEVEILADRPLLRRALVNGLGNGITHAPPGSALLVTLEREGELLVIRIADQGPGVIPEMQEQIFQPFFRVDSARSKEKGGFGLGLAITRRAMEAHGGGAVAETPKEGQGFVLKLWLPLKPFQGP